MTFVSRGSSTTARKKAVGTLPASYGQPLLALVNMNTMAERSALEKWPMPEDCKGGSVGLEERDLAASGHRPMDRMMRPGSPSRTRTRDHAARGEDLVVGLRPIH